MTLADVRFEEIGQSVIAHVTGEIDLSNAAALGRAIEDEMPNSILGLALDLTGVDYMDSAGIQLLFQLKENLRFRGQALALIVPFASAASDALRLAGVVARITTFETVDAALAATTPGEESRRR
jgi:anti-anti-sigma factor